MLSHQTPAHGGAIFFLWIVIFLATATDAAIYYVDGVNGNDSNGCNASPTPLTTTAKRTIATGIRDCLNAGDTLRIRGGNYTTTVDWTTNDPGMPLGGTSWATAITVEATPGETVVWNCVGEFCLGFGGNIWYVIIRGINFDGTNGTNILHVMVNQPPAGDRYTHLPVSGSASIWAFGCNGSLCPKFLRFENNRAGNTAYGIAGAYHDSFEYLHNYFHHAGKVDNNNVFYVAGPNVLFDGNTFESIKGSAIGFWHQGQPDVTGGIARNNFIINSGPYWGPQSQNGNHFMCGRSQAEADALYPATAPNVLPTDCARRSPGRILSGSTSISITQGVGTKVYNNILMNSAGILCSQGAIDAVIYNNTVYGNPFLGSSDPFDNNFDAGIGIPGYGGYRPTRCTVQNNIVYQPGLANPPPIFNGAPDSTISNNLCSSTATGTSCTQGNPGFVSTAGGDFQLTAGSPAVNTGLDLSSTCPGCVTDQVGTPRPAGAWDLGALERATAPSPDPVSLLAWWKLDEGSGLSAADSTGTGHIGALDLAAWGPGILFPFGFKPTSTQEITVVNTFGLDRTTSISVTGWFLPTVGATDCPLLSNKETYSLYVGTDGRAQGWIWNGSSYEAVTGGTSVAGTPHMLTLTYDSGVASPTMRLYVDAVQVGATATSSTMVYNQPGGAFRIARDGLSFGTQCPGTYQDVRVYSGQLDQASITNLFNAVAPPPGMSVSHARYATADQPLGTFLAAVDTDHALVLGSPFRLRWALHKSDTGSLTEYFRVFCRTFTSGAWNAWTEVSNTLGSLGVRFHTDSAVNLGDAVPALLPLDTFAPVTGKVIADTVDLTSPYDAGQRITLAQGEHAEEEAALVTGSPLIAGNLVQCRPQRENAAAFCTDCYGGPASTAIRTLTLQSVAPPSSVRLGGQMQGGTFQ